jgi:hypothetical protein
MKMKIGTVSGELALSSCVYSQSTPIGEEEDSLISISGKSDKYGGSCGSVIGSFLCC